MNKPPGTINVGRYTSGGAFGGLLGNQFRRGDVCKACGGDGTHDGDTPCWICDGHGQLVNVEHCMKAYESWLRHEVSRPASPVRHVLAELRGKKLWCPGCGSDSPMCHARIIEKVMSELGKSYRIGRNGKIALIQQAQDKSCRKCGLFESSKNVCIMGRGNPMAHVVLLGEAPGEAEAMYGKPFCGKSGQWLQKQIDLLDMTNQVYITNSCRCRPPDNRKPTAFEIKQCNSYLIRELEIVKPRVVVAMGRTAMQSLGITHAEQHQALHSIRHSFRIILTWHPAYVLRMGTSSRIANDFVSSLKLAKEFIK